MRHAQEDVDSGRVVGNDDCKGWVGGLLAANPSDANKADAAQAGAADEAADRRHDASAKGGGEEQRDGAKEVERQEEDEKGGGLYWKHKDGEEDEPGVIGVMVIGWRVGDAHLTCCQVLSGPWPRSPYTSLRTNGANAGSSTPRWVIERLDGACVKMSDDAERFLSLTSKGSCASLPRRAASVTTADAVMMYTMI